MAPPTGGLGQRCFRSQAPVSFPLPVPQVRPKTHIPDSLPRSPCQEPAPLGQQRATAVVSPPSQGAATLPTANSTLSPDGGPDFNPPATAAQHATAGPGVAYAIIAASPANGNRASAVSEAVKVGQLTTGCSTCSCITVSHLRVCVFVCVCGQVIIIQPQAPSGSDASPDNQASVPSQDSSCHSPSPKRHTEDPEVNPPAAPSQLTGQQPISRQLADLLLSLHRNWLLWCPWAW